MNGEPLEAALRRYFSEHVEPTLEATWRPGPVAAQLESVFDWNEDYAAEARVKAAYTVVSKVSRRKTKGGREWVVTPTGDRKAAEQMVLEDFDVMIAMHSDQEAEHAFEGRFWNQLRGAFVLRCAERGLDPMTTARVTVVSEAEVKALRAAA